MQSGNSALCPDMGTRVSICPWLVFEVEHDDVSPKPGPVKHDMT